jgi:hypothetical protein
LRQYCRIAIAIRKLIQNQMRRAAVDITDHGPKFEIGSLQQTPDPVENAVAVALQVGASPSHIA